MLMVSKATYNLKLVTRVLSTFGLIDSQVGLLLQLSILSLYQLACVKGLLSTHRATLL